MRRHSTPARRARHLLGRALARLRDMVEPRPPLPAAGEPACRVLFVCKGNICRSSLAHGLFRAELARRALLGRAVVDSAGTSDYNAGRRPHWRARACARRHGFGIQDLRARQVTVDDFSRFDLLVAMDAENVAHLRSLAPELDDTRRIVRLMPTDVVDPVEGGDDAFETAFAEIEAGCRRLLDKIAAETTQP